MSLHDDSLSDQSPSLSPTQTSPPSNPFRVPSRRTRTISESEKILAGPTFHGQISSFCRQKGHGHITQTNGEQLFVHISDIEGEFVPKEGDRVSYKRCPIPPKNEKFSAVHVEIVYKDDVPHERWDENRPRNAMTS